MNLDEPAAHFAWDLLDSAKQVAPLRSTETQGTQKPAAAEPEPDAPDLRPHSQSVMPVASALDEAPIGQHEPPTDPPEPEADGSPTGGQPPAAAIILTEAAAAIEEASTATLQPEPPVEKKPASVRMPGESGWPPMLGPQPLPVQSNGDIPKLSWNDVGMATEPGQYKSRYGLVQVRAEEIWIWKMHPNATFVVMQPSPYSDRDVSRLGSFDLGSQERLARDEK